MMEKEIGEPIQGLEIKTQLKDAKIEENVDTSLNDEDPDQADEESFGQPKSACKKAGRFQCITCKKAFFHKSVLKKHNKTVHDGLRFPCHFCDHKATQQQSLYRHIKNKHGC